MASNVTRMVAVDSLVFADNVRSPECACIPQMVESFRRSGYKVNHPLVVSEKTDGTHLVLCGNRRGIALQWLRDNDNGAYRAACPSDCKIPAVVHKGLTVEEETLLRIDHSTDEDRVPLDEWSTYLAIRQLALVGIDTQERIADKLGLYYAKGKNKGQANRSYVQPRLNLARLPSFVEDTMREYTIDKDRTPLRWSHVAGLYKAYNAEFVDYPEGNGPEFVKAWEKAITPVESKEEKDKGEKKELTPADAVKRAQVASSVGLARAMLVLTGQSTDDISIIDREMVEGETAITTLAMIKDYLGNDDYNQLIVSAKEQRELQEATPDSAIPTEEVSTS